MEKTEELRKNLKVNSMQHAFMVERTLAKQDYQKTCGDIRKEAKGKQDVVKRIYEAECVKIKATADQECTKAQARYFDKIADIAERENAFKHEVAEYVASLQPAANNEEIHFEY